MTALREQLVNFIAQLRAAGVRISVAETIDAMNAVAAAGLERARMREALAASLVKDEADRFTFDDTFDRFFAAPPRSRGEHPNHPGAQVSAASGRGRPGENPVPREDSPTRKAEHPLSGTEPKGQRPEVDKGRKSQQPRDGAEKSESGKRSDAEAAGGNDKSSEFDIRGHYPGLDRQSAQSSDAARAARTREIERKPFEKYSELDYDEARDALAPLIRRFRIRLGRRLRMARVGRIDFRRTIRAGLQRGGALIDLNFRARRPRRVDLVILADVSGSVRYAAQLTLELMEGARACFHRVASFVYVDHLAEAEFEQGHLVMTPPLDLYARSDFGRVLGELWHRREGLLTRRTVLVILGDGRNNRRPARANLLREIARNCRGAIWLNPEDPARWGTGDSEIRQYEREVTALVPSRNLRELKAGLLKVA